MTFDPTIRLDFIIVAAGVLFYVARLEAKVAAISQAQERITDVLDGMEKRVRDAELDIAHHLGEKNGKTVNGVGL